MTDYTQTTFFGPKDLLTTGDPLKRIRGTEVDVELNSIATSIATKYDTAGTGLTATGSTVNAVGGTGIRANANDLELDIAGLTPQGTPAATGDFVGVELAGGGKRRVTVANLVADQGLVPQTRNIIASNGLGGGGTLATDIDFRVNAGNGLDIISDNVVLDTANPRNTDHAAVSITAGTGLSGGGSINNSLTLNLDQATESALGGAEIATQAETDAGTDDTRIVTPKKLAAYTALPGAALSATKTVAEAVLSSTVLQNDNDLVITGIAQNTLYYFNLSFEWEGATGDLAFQLTTTGIPTNVTSLRYTNNEGELLERTGRLLLDVRTVCIDTNITPKNLVTVSGPIQFSANNASITMQWAQNASSVFQTFVNSGAMILLPVG